MKVNLNNKNINYKGYCNNRIIKKGLEFAAENSLLFAGTTSFAMSLLTRPAAIMMTPKTDIENKKIACAKSISSSIINFLITLAISVPFAKSIQNINKKPAEFLTKETIENFKGIEKNIENSKSYQLATEMFKLGLGMIVAAPKSICTAKTVPFVLNNLFSNKNKKDEFKDNELKNISFKGENNILSKNISKILNKKEFQNFAKKHQNSNFPLNILAITDSISTLAFIKQIKKENIEEKRKKPIIYNSIISTALCILSSYFIDKISDNKTQKIITNFIEHNKNDKNLDKYIKGIKIAKPTLILSLTYYILIPLISTFSADRIDNKLKL